MQTVSPTSLESQPTSQPSNQPSAVPSRAAVCYPGHYYILKGYSNLTQSLESYECVPCPAGTYSGYVLRQQCYQTKPGYYSPEGSEVEFMCPPNTYSSVNGTSDKCPPCPQLFVSPPGNSLNSCINPTPSFYSAFVFLFICGVFILWYVLGGKLNRLAYHRKESLVKSACKVHSELSLILNNLNEKYRISSDNKNTASSASGYAFRILMFCSLVVLIIAITFFVCIYSTFYTGMILYRGYVSLPNVVANTFANRLRLYVDQLQFFLQIPVLGIVLSGLNKAVNFFATLSINFNFATLNCSGAIAPLQLFVNCVFAGVTILVVESEMEVFWSTSFSNSHNAFRNLLLRSPFWKEYKWRNVLFLLWSVVLQVIPRPRAAIQFGLGFFKLYLFFSNNFMATYSSYCNTGIYHNWDYTIALLSSIVVYFCMLPAVFMLSQVLSPFSFDSGFVAVSSKAKRKLHVIQCANCNLPLSRKCLECSLVCSVNGPNCNSLTGNAMSKESVFYGCTRFEKCNWIACQNCYQSLATSSITCAESLTSEEKNWICIYYDNIMSLISVLALERLYLNHISWFAKSLRCVVDGVGIERMNQLLLEKESTKTSIMVESERIESEWILQTTIVPSYYGLIRTVFEDLMPKFRHNGVICCMCGTEIVGHLYYSKTNSSWSVCENCLPYSKEENLQKHTQCSTLGTLRLFLPTPCHFGF